MAVQPLTAGQAEELDQLYRVLAEPLERIVRSDVRAPRAVIEDACQVAWGRLLDQSDRIRRETALAWLAATAVHEAVRLLRRGRRELSLEATIEEAGDSAVGTRVVGPGELLEQRERIAGLANLPSRQQRLIWLQALGLSYAEMAAHERCTTRTVERQLFRARERLRKRPVGAAAASAPGLACGVVARLG